MAPGFFATLMSTPPGPASLLSRYTVANGVLYLVIGVSFYIAPASLLTLAAGTELPGQEVGLLRVLGMAVALIGWFYVFGGRTRADSFGLCTVADRAVVPLLLVPLWLSGQVAPMLVLPFAILDPLLALGALGIWLRERPDVG